MADDNKTVVNNVTNVSYNGGTGGTTATPTPAQLAAANEQHVAPTAAQTQHAQTAAKDPSLALNNNQGHPTVAATSSAGQFKGSGVVAAHPGQPVAAIQPQGHHVSTRTTPSAGTATITPSTTTTGPKPSTAATAPAAKPGTSSATTKPGTGTATATPGGGKPGTATTTTGNRPGAAATATPNVREQKGEARGGPSGRGPQPQVNKPPSTSTAAHAPSTAGHTPPPPVNKPPPPPHVAGPPPRPPGPSPHPPGGGGKPKCEPGQHC